MATDELSSPVVLDLEASEPSLPSSDANSDANSEHTQPEASNTAGQEVPPSIARYASNYPPRTKEFDTKLLEAASYGRIPDVVKFLQEGADIAAQQNNGETALHLSARHGFFDQAKLLLQYMNAVKVDINIKDTDGWIALYGAARYDHADIVKLLLENGADINALNNEEWTPLHGAARNGSTEAAKELLGKWDPPADIEAKVRDGGETPLHLASRFGQARVVEILLEHGAFINAWDSDGWTPIYGAASHGRADVIKVLLEADPPADVKPNIRLADTALHAATRRGYEDCITELLKHEDIIDLPNEKGWTALCSASGAGQKNIVQLLLKEGADPTIRTKDSGETALHVAIREGFPDIVEELLKIQTIIDIVDDDGWTPLHTAASYGHKGIVDLLLEKNSEMLPARTLKNETAVHLAAKKGHEDVVITLIQNMTERSRFDNRLSPSDALWAGARPSVLSAGFSALHWAAYYGHDTVVYWLLVNGSSFKARDARGKTPLDIAEHRLLKLMEIASKPVDVRASLDKALRRGSKAPVEEKPKENKDRDQSEQVGEKDGDERRRKPKSGEERYKRIIDLLQDPPVVQGRSDLDQAYDFPLLRDEKQQSVCKEYRATIMDFYERDEHIDFLRRTRSVYDVIYEDGPSYIMNTALEDIQALLPEVDPLPTKADDDGTEVAPRRQYLSKDDLKFRWIHLPANNIEWMRDLVMRICKDRETDKDYFLPLSKFVRDTVFELPGRAAKAKLMKPGCRRDSKVESRLAIYMPYLTFAQHCKIHTPEMARYDRLMEAYEGKTVHGSQTLDQFFYHDLSDRDSTTLDTRDSDQVVTRYIERPRPKDQWGNKWTILRVDQLWLWAIDEKTIITSSTHRLDREEDPVLERIYDQLCKEKGVGRGQAPPASADEMTKFITNFCIGFLDQYETRIKHENSNKSAKEIFAISVNDKAIEESDLFRKFVRGIDKKISSMNPNAKSKGLLPHRNHIFTSPYGQDDDGEHKAGPYESISVAAHLLEEVKDIRDELSILRSLLQHQKTVWDSLFRVSSKKEKKAKNQNRPSEEAEEEELSATTSGPQNGNGKVSGFDGVDRGGPDFNIEEIEEMDRSATRIQASVNSLLDLDQNEANISEAQQTTQQGRTLMVFTIVTLIFLPMSFLASLFDLDITVFPHTDGDVVFEPGYIFPIIFGVTVAISFPLVLIAFYVNTLMTVMRPFQWVPTKLFDITWGRRRRGREKKQSSRSSTSSPSIKDDWELDGALNGNGNAKGVSRVKTMSREDMAKATV